MDIESEIEDLKRRVGDLEGTVSVITARIGNVPPELVALQQLTSCRFDGVDAAMNRFVSRLDNMNTQVWSLRDDLPELGNLRS